MQVTLFEYKSDWSSETETNSYRWDQQENLWYPVKIRHDKQIPNNLTTFKLTSQNIQEAISPTKMYRLLKPS